MPKKLDRCVKKVSRKMGANGAPLGKAAWPICVSSLKKKKKK